MTLSSATVMAAIGSGEFDTDLAKIQEAVELRLSQTRSSKTIKDFGIGDKVRLNNNCGTRYLVGHTGKIVGMKRTKLVITLDSPVGKFIRVNPATREIESAQITIPTALVDLI
jgi:hypothetical protein